MGRDYPARMCFVQHTDKPLFCRGELCSPAGVRSTPLQHKHIFYVEDDAGIVPLFCGKQRDSSANASE